jgi:hypothetical protein
VNSNPAQLRGGGRVWSFFAKGTAMRLYSQRHPDMSALFLSVEVALRKLQARSQ